MTGWGVSCPQQTFRFPVSPCSFFFQTANRQPLTANICLEGRDVITIASFLGATAPEDSAWCCPYLAPRLTKGGQPYL